MNRTIDRLAVLLACMFCAAPWTALGQQALPSGTQFVGHGSAWPAPWFGVDGNPSALGEASGDIGVWGGSAALGGGLALSLGGLKLGTTVDHLMPDGAPELWRFGLGLALAPSPAFRLAGYWKPLWQDGEGGAAVDGWSLGTLFAPARWLSFGVEAHNLGRERLGASDDVSLAGGLALRPLGERFTVGADVGTTQDGSFWDLTGYFGWDLVDGVSLGASGGVVDVSGEAEAWAGGSFSFLIPHAQAVLNAGVAGRDSEFVYSAAGRMSVDSPPRHMDVGHVVVRMTLAVNPETPGLAFFAPRTAALLEQRLMLQRLARDPKVAGVVLRIERGQGGWAAVQEMGRSLAEIRASGKKVVAYLYGGGNREYYLASFADKVVVHPAAVLSVTGIRATMTFFADLLRLVGVEPQFVRIGPWKGAPEAYTRTEPSPELLQSQSDMLDDVFAQLVGPIAANRKVPAEVVRQWVDAGPQTPQKALALGMVDEVADLEEMNSLREMGLADVRVVQGYPYTSTQDDTWGPQTDVAVLVIEGTLVDGRSGGIPVLGTLVGADDLVPLIKALEKDAATSAVLVRVNSPGGSPLASERILLALKNLAKAKPVVVSMGDVAASGGYYLSMAGARLLAMPGTVTGSIGIFYGKFVISGLLDKLQVRRTHLERGKHSGWDDMDRPLDQQDLAFAKERLLEYYDLFLQRVEAGRGLRRTELEALAEGRVFSGQRAVINRLVDAEGGCLEALEALKTALDVDQGTHVALQFYPQPTFSALLQKSLGLGLGGATAQQLQGLLDSLSQFAGTRVWALEPWIPLHVE